MSRKYKPKKVRVFSGKRYELLSTHRLKRSALKTKVSQIEGGERARVIKFKDRYAVYVRGGVRD